jgi:hypothetical protein
MNGTESGVDCGGSCRLYCSAQVSAPVVLWSRIFPISGSKYNLIAYVENQNIDAAVPDINYEFRVYDTEGKLIGRREGHTFIPPNQRFGIFEAHFDVVKALQKIQFFNLQAHLFGLNSPQSPKPFRLGLIVLLIPRTMTHLCCKLVFVMIPSSMHQASI